jgi:hypothetical protein
VSVEGKLRKQRRYQARLAWAAAQVEAQREAKEAQGARPFRTKGIGGARLLRTGRVVPGEIERAYLLGDKRERQRIEEFRRPPAGEPKAEKPRTIPPAEAEPIAWWRGGRPTSPKKWEGEEDRL